MKQGVLRSPLPKSDPGNSQCFIQPGVQGDGGGEQWVGAVALSRGTWLGLFASEGVE